MTPCEGTNRVTSRHGWRTLRGVKQWHAGIDIVGARRLRAIWTAMLVEVLWGWNGGRGNLVRLYYSKNLRVIYQHLNEIYVANGSVVKQGDVIGLMGWSGDCVPQGESGMHLHIEVQVRGADGVWRDVNPAQYIEVLNVIGGHPGNDNLDAVTGEPKATEISTKGVVKGDIVAFAGGQCFVSSAGGKGYLASAGEAKVTYVNQGDPYPFHLEYVKGGTSSVYGWVAADRIVQRPVTPEPVPAVITKYKAGDRLTFSSGYCNSTDGPDKALHVAKKQLLVDRGMVGAVLTVGAVNPLLLVSIADGKTPICWCNDGDISGRW